MDLVRLCVQEVQSICHLGGTQQPTSQVMKFQTSYQQRIDNYSDKLSSSAAAIALIALQQCQRVTWVFCIDTECKGPQHYILDSITLGCKRQKLFNTES